MSKILDILSNLFVKKQCFEVYYVDKHNNEGRIKVYVKNVNDVDSYFKKKYPHLELYDIGEKGSF